MPQSAKREVLPVNLAFKAEIKKDNAPLRVKQDDRRSVGNANAIPSAHAKGGGMAGRNALADKDGDLNKNFPADKVQRVRPRSNYGSAAAEAKNRIDAVKPKSI